MIRQLKRCYRWLFGDEGTLVEVCDAFTLVTVVNSVMMVTGYDTPKVGEWAYGHLLLRLGIVLLAFTIWDARGVLDDLEKYAAVLRRRPSSHVQHLRRLPRLTAASPFNSICVTFTASIVVICITTILVVPQPTGGADFYVAVLALFGAICVTVISLVGIDKIGSWRRASAKSGCREFRRPGRSAPRVR